MNALEVLAKYLDTKPEDLEVASADGETFETNDARYVVVKHDEEVERHIEDYSRCTIMDDEGYLIFHNGEQDGAQGLLGPITLKLRHAKK